MTDGSTMLKQLLPNDVKLLNSPIAGQFKLVLLWCANSVFLLIRSVNISLVFMWLMCVVDVCY